MSRPLVDIRLDAVFLLPATWTDEPPRVVVLLDEGGKAAALDSADAEVARSSGCALLAPDLRGTGESFAANIGGRLIGTAAFFITQKLAVAFGPANATPAQAAHAIAYTAAGVALVVTLVGLIASFFLPQPPHQDAEH